MKPYDRMTKTELVNALRSLQPTSGRASNPSGGRSETSADETQRLVHELQVHQIELEMQNRELQEARQELEASRNRYVDLYDFAPAAYVTLDDKGCLVEINLTGAALLGRERARLVGTPFLRFVAKHHANTFLAHLQQFRHAAGTVTTEVDLDLQHGRSIPVQLVSVSVQDDERRAAVYRTTITDLTEYKRAENALRNMHDTLEVRVRERTAELSNANIALQGEVKMRQQAEDALRRVNDDLERRVSERTAELVAEKDLLQRYLDVAGVMIVVIGADETVAMINKNGCEVLGYEERELLGKSWIETCLPERIRSEIRHAFSRLMAGNLAPHEFVQNSVVTKTGEERIVAWHNAVLRDEQGRIWATISSGEDITEKLVLEEQVRQADKLAVVGQLTTGLAHEIGTPLSIIGGRAETMLRKLAPDDPMRVNLEGILKQIDRITKLVDQLCAFARSRPSARRSITLAPLVREVLSLVDQHVRDNDIAVEVDCADGLPSIVADPDQIQQVLLNLIMNAIQAMPEGGRLTVRAGRTVARLNREDPLKDRYVKLEVVDEGVGIASEHLGKVFDPFFTTKDLGKGTGLGLSISSRIVRNHGGWIRVKSRVGEGATFSAYLPLADDSSGAGMTAGTSGHV